MRPSVLAMAHQRSECRLQDSHTQHYTVQTPESLFWLPPLNINCIAVRNLCHPASKDWAKRGLWVCICPSCHGQCRRCERYGNVCWETLEQVPAWSPAPAHRGSACTSNNTNISICQKYFNVWGIHWEYLHGECSYSEIYFYSLIQIFKRPFPRI